jgi:hypothetical protein
MASNNPGNTNQFVCTASTLGSATGPNSCVIVQSSTGTDNNATCTEKIGDPTGDQTCEIYQLNTTAANNATVQQQLAAGQGSTQDATQSTTIAQWNTSGSNSAQVNQDLKESETAALAKTDPAFTQQQDGHQTTSLSQHSDSGNNTAKVLQSLQLKQSATGGTAITQLQDTKTGDYNTSAAIYQNSDQDFGPITSTGANSAYLFQSNDLNASGAKTGSLTQTQGAFDNGLFGHVDQRSTGLSTSQTNQNEHQSLGASQIPAGQLSQTQIGPMFYDPNQASNPGDTMNVSQSSDQNAGGGAAQDDIEEASCEVSGGGLCTVTEKVANDHQNGTNSCSDSSCDISLEAKSPCGLEIDCSGGIQTCNDSECTEAPHAPPPDPLDPSSDPSICDFLPAAPPCFVIR